MPSPGSQERTAELVAGLERLTFSRIVDFSERQRRGRDQCCLPAPGCHAEWDLGGGCLSQTPNKLSGWTSKGPSTLPEVTPHLSHSTLPSPQWHPELLVMADGWPHVPQPSCVFSSTLYPHILLCWVLPLPFAHLSPCPSFLHSLSSLHFSFLLHHLAQISSLSLPSPLHGRYKPSLSL